MNGLRQRRKSAGGIGWNQSGIPAAPSRERMNSRQGDWIDPAKARRLMLEYQQALRIGGASEIAENIAKYAQEDINRKTLENWLSGKEPNPRPKSLAAVEKFIRTLHFQRIVEHAHDHLDADARLHRIGSALFNLHGAMSKDVLELKRLNGLIAGWWVNCDINDPPQPPQSFVYIAPIPAHPFSRICLSLPHRIPVPFPDHPPQGSGIVFPKAEPMKREGKGFQPAKALPNGSTAGFPKKDSLSEIAYMARLWLNEDMQERPMQIIYRRDKFSEDFFLHYWSRVSPGHAVLESFCRADANVIPAAIRDIFDEWSDAVIPRGTET